MRRSGLSFLAESAAGITQEETMGHDFQLEENVPGNIECAICLFILRDAMETPCSHVLCKLCVDKLLSIAEEK